MSKTPIPCSLGFENLPLSAQALFFHLAIRANEEGYITAGQATMVREHIGATDEDVKALLRNRFVVTDGGRLHVEKDATYPSLVVENGQEDVILYIFHRTAIWRQTVAAYEQELARRVSTATGNEWNN